MPDDNLFLPVSAVLPPTEVVRAKTGVVAHFNPSELIEQEIRKLAEREGLSVEEVARIISEAGDE